MRNLTLATAVLVACAFAAPPAFARAPLVAAMGDIACAAAVVPASTRCQQAAVAAAVRRAGPSSLWLLGDIQYGNGALSDFQGSFAASWGSMRKLMRPIPGNHEYYTPGAAGYFDFFAAAAGPARRGYYSFDVGRWHVVALNSNCDIVGCGEESAQARWLRADLASHPRQCTAALWHHPRYSSGANHGDDPVTRPLWRILARSRAELVLSGHEHDFEVFKRQDSISRADPARGLQQFVVGTGGVGAYDFARPRPNSFVRKSGAFGFLALRLHPERFTWRFIGVDGRSLASGRAHCR